MVVALAAVGTVLTESPFPDPGSDSFLVVIHRAVRVDVRVGRLGAEDGRGGRLENEMQLVHPGLGEQVKQLTRGLFHKTLFSVSLSSVGGRHCSVDLSSPTILRSWVQIPSTPSIFL